MAKLIMLGLDEYIEQLERLGKSSRGIIKQALYDGADIITNEIRKETENLPIDEKWGTPENPTTGIRKKQKVELLESLGISKMREEDGITDVRIGFKGYNSIKTRLYPQGQPNRLIARSIESGTSFSKKIPFFRKAVKRAEAPALQKMKETMEKEMEKIMKG